MGILEQLINTESMNLIIGITLIVLAVIALVWMYSWSKKSKEYNQILKSIDDKVEACSNEELGKELRSLTRQANKDVCKKDGAKDKEAVAAVKVVAKKEEPKTKHNFNRAMAAIETLERDQFDNATSETVKVAKENLAVEKELAEKARAEKNVADRLEAAKAEAEKIKDEVAKAARASETKPAMNDMDDLMDIHVKTVELPKETSPEVRWDDANTVEKVVEEPVTSIDDDEEEECAVDVFAEIRKMLVETEKQSEKLMPEKIEEAGNIAKSGKEYTREELENLIKF